MFKQDFECGYVYPNTEIINISSDHDTIWIHYNNQTITLAACGECCSTSVFKLPTKYVDFDEIVGKILISVEESFEVDETIYESDIDSEESEDNNCHYNGECIKMHYYIMTFTDDTTFNFALANTSNGYYDGWIELMQDYDDRTKKLFEDVIVTIVIGLPGSGKSHKSRELASQCDAKILDDSLSDHEQFLKSVNQHNRLIVNDPRFCDSKTFKQFITMAKSFLLPDNIKIVLFENNPITCAQNIIAREKDPKMIKYLTDFIRKYSAIYNPKNKIYAECSYTIVPVWEEHK